MRNVPLELQCGCLSTCKGPQARAGDRVRNSVQRADVGHAPDAEAPTAEYVIHYPTGKSVSSRIVRISLVLWRSFGFCTHSVLGLQVSEDPRKAPVLEQHPMGSCLN